MNPAWTDGYGAIDLFDGQGHPLNRVWADRAETRVGVKIDIGVESLQKSAVSPAIGGNLSRADVRLGVSNANSGLHSAIFWAAGSVRDWSYYLNDTGGTVVATAQGDSTYFIKAENFTSGVTFSEVVGVTNAGGVTAGYSLPVGNHLILHSFEAPTGKADVEHDGSRTDCPCLLREMMGPAQAGSVYQLHWTGSYDAAVTRGDHVFAAVDAYLPGIS